MRLLIALIAVACTSAAWAQTDANHYAPWLGERKIQGEFNLEAIGATVGTEIYQHAQVVARMEWRHDGDGFCTASRVGQDLFLTNSHCVQASRCDNLQFTMGFQDNVDEDQRQVFHCRELVMQNSDLDYAIYRAVAISTHNEREQNYPTLALWVGGVALEQELMLASHPSGRLKEVDRSDECRWKSLEVERISGRDSVRHLCDTEGGSSGSPVIDANTGHAVALHWGGKSNEFNMAILMSMIVADLEESLPPADFNQLTIIH